MVWIVAQLLFLQREVVLLETRELLMEAVMQSVRVAPMASSIGMSAAAELGQVF